MILSSEVRCKPEEGKTPPYLAHCCILSDSRSARHTAGAQAVLLSEWGQRSMTTGLGVWLCCRHFDIFPSFLLCAFFFYFVLKESESEVAQSCPTLCDPMDCSLPGSSVHGIFFFLLCVRI